MIFVSAENGKVWEYYDNPMEATHGVHAKDGNSVVEICGEIVHFWESEQGNHNFYNEVAKYKIVNLLMVKKFLKQFCLNDSIPDFFDDIFFVPVKYISENVTINKINHQLKKEQIVALYVPRHY